LYKEGRHLISEFEVKDPLILKDASLVRKYLDTAIAKYQLSKVGEVYHQFPGSGYTAVVCLTESHISIHTWPEYNKVTFDVFLSNFLKYNDDIVEAIHTELLDLLEARVINITKLKR
jgi:S-adenosylmethionine decarboxylase